MNCRSCGTGTETVLDLGDHYLPDFTGPGEPRGPKYPLRLEFCPGCTLLQLAETTPRDALYHERYGFKSGVNEAIRADLADVVRYASAAADAPQGRQARWLDIACNDGTLLSNVPEGVHRAGIDPLSQFAAEARAHADEVIPDYFRPRHFRPGEFDVITSVSMFYDLDDPISFAKGVASVLADKGAWVIQQNYAAEMLRQNAVDNLCHEHVTYFSVTSLIPVLAAAGLEVNDVAYSSVNGGCFRTLVTREGTRHVLPSVAEALGAEKAMGLGEAETYVRWAEKVRAELAKTRDLLDQAKANGERVLVYGASTRGGTILQMIDAGPELLPAAVERNPAKVGKVMAATGIPIISEEEMRADPPEYLLVSPWFFKSVFVERERPYLEAGGRMVFPLPRFEVAGG
jgi:NDP-4-keto-2,6-dideoxyhexose 3-C-methyltransferase